ncbi:hypothetical protein [Methanosarcina sp. UBA5]|uniref:hypothetical protein n=1 Tax=Methanosarcina sp. UBA5 TaxID=1915593 RepID=UPI0025DB1CCA|nr:hypothetical protein [Methanosarcina sp. UBA5]
MLPKTIITTRKPEDRKKGGLSCFSKGESAAATVIAAVLLLALIFTVISVVKLEYVPEWKNDAEMNHMYDTWDEMVGVKTRIDVLSRLMESENYSAYSISATVPVNIGGGEVPAFDSSKSDGKLEVNTEKCTMIVTPYSPSQRIKPYIIECGGITCYSENRQYPDQVFRYENGALILADGENSRMKQFPIFGIEKTEGNNYTFTLGAVQILGKPDSISSNAITPLRLTGWGVQPMHNSSDYIGINISAFNLTIATKYPDAWTAYFNETAQEKGLANGTDYTVRCMPESGHVRFSFLGNGSKKLEWLYISKAKIGAELGSGSSFNANYRTGWIENIMRLNKWYCFDTITGTYKNSQISPNPNLLRDYNSNLTFPSGSNKVIKLVSYNPNNSFSQKIDKNKELVMNFNFVDYTEFDVISPSSATIRMIYRYGTNSSQLSTKMKFTGTEDSLNPQDNNWYLYNNKFSVSPKTPSDLNLSLYINDGSNAGGTFYIDYLAVYLS